MAAEDYIDTGYWPDDEEDQSQERVLVEIESIDRETDKALLVTIKGKQFWVPKSQCEVVKCIAMPMWLVEKNELEQPERAYQVPIQEQWGE